MEGLEEVKGRFWATIRTPVPSSHGPWVAGGWGLRLLGWGRMCHIVCIWFCAAFRELSHLSTVPSDSEIFNKD